MIDIDVREIWDLLEIFNAAKITFKCTTIIHTCDICKIQIKSIFLEPPLVLGDLNDEL